MDGATLDHTCAVRTKRLRLYPGYSEVFEGTNGWGKNELEEALGPFTRLQIQLERTSDTCFRIIFHFQWQMKKWQEPYAGNFRDRFLRKERGWPFVIAEVHKDPAYIELEFRCPD